FFQAEDGIRDFHVTGVQTCALPISSSMGTAVPTTGHSRAARRVSRCSAPLFHFETGSPVPTGGQFRLGKASSAARTIFFARRTRSEERRVGKEWRARRSASE